MLDVTMLPEIFPFALHCEHETDNSARRFSMEPVIVVADQVRPKPWRNQGGLTRDLLVWPPDNEEDTWEVRISRADITTDGPFSAYTGVERWFKLIDGNGLTLRVHGQDCPVHAADPPFVFDGGAMPHCHLLGGPAQVLNFMTRRTEMRSMQATRPGQPWAASYQWRGLYTCARGRWSDGRSRVPLGAHTLLWQVASDRDWHFAPDEASYAQQAWWMGFASPLNS